jgi:hypothetical protein
VFYLLPLWNRWCLNLWGRCMNLTSNHIKWHPKNNDENDHLSRIWGYLYMPILIDRSTTQIGGCLITWAVLQVRTMRPNSFIRSSFSLWIMRLVIWIRLIGERSANLESNNRIDSVTKPAWSSYVTCDELQTWCGSCNNTFSPSSPSSKSGPSLPRWAQILVCCLR